MLPVSSTTQTQTSTSTSAESTSSATNSMANESTFLKLLVAQLQNQNPDSPADGTQFVTQLAQFSSLEQQIQMRQDLDAIKQSAQTPATQTGPTKQS